MEVTSSDDDEACVSLRTASFVPLSAVGQPYCRYQGSYLFNLLKLLNEAQDMNVLHVIRWSSKIWNAIEINWALMTQPQVFTQVHPQLVKYKLSRASNQPECVRPTMNRKLREWNFTMIPTHTSWVTYVYENERFNPEAQHGDLPTCRRQHPSI